MSREITDTNTYLEKLFKLIPSEVVATYLAIQGLVATEPDVQKYVVIGAGVILLIAIPFYLWRVQNVKSKIQIILTMISFIVWVFSIGGPFLYFLWYLPTYGSIVLILWTFLLPILKII